MVARLVPTSSEMKSAARSGDKPRAPEMARSMRVSTLAVSESGGPPPTAMRAPPMPAWMACPRLAPQMPALTAAATAAAPARATGVLWVTRQAARTRSTMAAVMSGKGKSGRPVAMPTGVMRIAAPFVSPPRPACSGGVPARTAATARLVEGPSSPWRPRAAMSRSQSTRAVAHSTGSISPAPRTRMRPSRTACSVSSVTVPAGRPAAMGLSGGAGSNPVSRGPHRSMTCCRVKPSVGMPRASPIARPCKAPRARSRSGIAPPRNAGFTCVAVVCEANATHFARARKEPPR